MAELFDGLEPENLEPRYNIAPTQDVAAIRKDGSPELAWLRWGLLPWWASEKKIGSRMINARCETVREKPAFRDAFQRRRCLVLADGFYEWKATADGKQPVFIRMKDGQPFAMAGLWEINRQIDSEPIESCTVITTSANPLMVPIHDRMPVILQTDNYDMWLDSDFQNYDALQGLLQPYDAEQMVAYPVSRRVNKATYDAADCIEPVAVQGDLF